MKAFATALTLALLATGAQAQVRDKAFLVGLHLASIHDLEGFENSNPGVYVRYGGWTAGALRNSVRTDSVYVGYTLDWRITDVPLVHSVALTGGLVSGYPRKIKGTDVSGLVVPSIAFNSYKGVALRVAVLPAVESFTNTSALHFMMETSF